jgi:arylsulfatase A-like enzyme
MHKPSAAVWLLLLASGTSVRAGTEGRPNIILLLTDDQRYDSLGATGNPLAHTPHLDALAKQGVVFDNAFVTSSLCPTSRASILLGQWARRHGIWDFERSLSPEQLSQAYPGVLRAAGYYTGFVGKWGVGPPPENYFDYSTAFAGQGSHHVSTGGEARPLSAVLEEQIDGFLTQLPEGRPFVLSVSFKAPHAEDSYNLLSTVFPAGPEAGALYENVVFPDSSEEEARRFEALPAFLRDSENRLRWAVRFWGPARSQEVLRGYYGLVTEVDGTVGRLRERLAEEGLAENTVILFASDNGLLLGERGLSGKWIAYEPSIHIPLVVFDPRLPASSRGTRRSELVLSVDLAPTILELGGAEAPARMQGRSLVAMLLGNSGPWREDFFYEHLYRHPRIPASEAVRTRSWKYIRWLESEPPREELYRLDGDPAEARDLASDPASQERLEALRRRWHELRTTLE